jgi:hypothetical protein
MGLSVLQIAQYAQQAGFSGLGLVNAVAVALAESGGDPGAHCLNCAGVPEDSQGLWQINLNAHPQYQGINMYDPLTNAKAAFAVSSGGSNFNPWSTFTNGAYKKYLGVASNVLGLIGGAAGGAVGGASSAVSSATGAVSSAGGAVGGAINTATATANSVTGAAGSVASSIASLATNIGAIGTNFQTAINDLLGLGQWLGQPNLWLRIVLVPVAVVLIVLGLILFALSFNNNRSLASVAGDVAKVAA